MIPRCPRSLEEDNKLISQKGLHLSPRGSYIHTVASIIKSLRDTRVAACMGFFVCVSVLLGLKADKLTLKMSG